MQKNSSMDNMYSSTYYRNVKKDEFLRGTQMYNKAQNPMETGIVPRPAFASMFAQVTDDNLGDNLTGEQRNNEDFKHNNMTPYLRGNVTQNTDIERMSNYTDRMSGNDLLRMKKQEVPCLFKPEPNNQVCTKGMKNNDEFLKSRIIDSNSRNNEFPIQQIRVGPGLNRGYSSSGVGGFQQFDNQNYARPVDLQNVKPKTDQTSKTFKIPFQGPRTNQVTKRQMQNKIDKNLPERTFEQGKENFFVTGGAITKPTVRSNQNITNTNATMTHIDYKGSAKDNNKIQDLKNDYGKSNVIVYSNERESYETKTTVSNLTSLVSAVVNPLIDTMKNSIKEFLIDAPRQEGMMNPQIPNAVTIHDPNDTTRTTIKETLIHDSEKLNLKGEDGTYNMIQDDARTTTKETLIHDSAKLNLKGEDGTYNALYDKAKTTTKETVAIKDVYRNIGGTIYKTISYSPDLVAKTTTKETTMHKTEGFMGGILEGLFGGYLSANPEAKNTNKQFTHHDYKGGISTYISNQTSHEATDNAEIDGTREKIIIDAAHTPNGGQSNLSKIHNGSINMKSNKSPVESLAYRKTHNPERVYQNTPNSNACGITKETDQLNSYENRLDKSMVSSLKENPFNISINPI